MEHTLLENIQVVIIDDSKIALSVMQSILTKYNCHVKTFLDPLEALAYLKESKTIIPDVIITDYGMPEMTGVEFIGEIKKCSHLVNVPTLILTGHNISEIYMSAINAGADAFASKSSIQEVIVAQLLALLRTSNLKKTQDTNHMIFKTAIEATGDGIWDLDLETKNLFLSGHFKEMLGYSFKEIGSNQDDWMKLIHPEDLSAVLNEFQEHISGKKSRFEIEHRILCKNGTYKWLLERGMIVGRDANGVPTRMLGTHVDVSSRKNFEDKLNQAQTIAQLGFWEWNAKTNFVAFDNVMLDLFALKESEFKNDYASFENLLVEEDALRMRSELKAQFEKREVVYQTDIRVKNKFGQIKYLKVCAKCLYDQDGNIDRMIGFDFDESERKALEASLLATAKMSTLGEFASGVAHEINNPLTIIKGKLKKIQKDIDSGDINLALIREDLAKIEKTSDRIAKIIRGLSSYSRNSKADPMESIKFSQIVEDTISLCEDRFKFKNIDLLVNSSEEFMLECRPSQIAQVVINLLSNAHDAIEKNEEKWVKLDVSHNDQFVLISVTDSGQGIPREIQEKILQPFFTTKTMGKGTGLGLSISKEIIEDHQGELSYDSSCNNTRFVLKIPLQQKKEDIDQKLAA